MSLFFALVLVAIAWFMSTIINGLPELWHIGFSIGPWWLTAALIASALAWFISD